MNKRVAFRVDASVNIGVGHVMRCLTLADCLLRCGIDSIFICRLFSGNRASFLEEKGYRVYSLQAPQSVKRTVDEGKGTTGDWSEVSWEQDAKETIEAIKDAGDIEWLVIDHYAIDQQWQHYLRPYAKKIMVIDDLANRPFDCDLLLDQTYGRESTDYIPFVSSSTEMLIGSQYALMRPQFFLRRQKALSRRRSVSGIHNILVSMGGMDSQNVTSLVLQGLEQVLWPTPVVVDVILVETAPNFCEVQKNVSNSSLSVKLHSNVDQMADLMLTADLAVGAGGTTSWERCCLGLPTIVLQTADNQRKLIQGLEKSGVIKNLGDCSGVTPEVVMAAVQPFLQDATYYKEMAEKAFVVSDGHGVQRVSKRIIGDSSVVALRPAEEADSEIIYKWQTFPGIRKYCRNPEIPSWPEHQKWFHGVLGDADKDLYVVCWGEDIIGMVRLDKKSEQDDIYEVSILIAPGFQGKGFARKTLDILRRIKHHSKLMAEVLAGNIVSQKLFEAAGYKRLDATWFVSLPSFYTATS